MGHCGSKRVSAERCRSIYDNFQLKVKMIDIANYHEVPVETVRTIIRRMSDDRSGRKIGRTLKLNDEMLEKLNTFFVIPIFNP